MSTVDELVRRTITRCNGAVARPRVNTLDAAITTTTATTLTVTYDPDANLTAGAVLEIDYEQLYVLEVNTTTRVVTVVRGWNNTTAATHVDNSIIYVEPAFPRRSVLDVVTDELRALPITIFAVDNYDLSWPARTNTVDLGASGEVYRVLGAHRVVGTEAVARTWRSLILQRGLSLATYPSGYAVSLPGALMFDEAVTLRVAVAVPLATTLVDETTDLQDDVGLPLSAEDIIVYGAASQMLMDKAAMRLDMVRAGTSRDAAEVSDDALGKLAQRWRLESQRRIAEEQIRLLELYPYGGA